MAWCAATKKALFRDCIYELPLRYMIKHGYLTPPERLDMPVVQYDFSRLQAQSNGLFSEADLQSRAEKTAAHYAAYRQPDC
ncbi:Uncharacterised protein [Raoultella terrigena]|nr:Uncharacterised protein [Raoultella terrigena]